MISLANIWNVARIEAKTLTRSWFFRIFAGLSLVILVLFDLLVFARIASINRGWIMRGISSSLPYSNLLLLNIAQAVIAVFLASDFLKRDKKLDTTEVIYMRSISNGDYVLGKTAGILLVFGALNLAALAVALVFNIFFADIPVCWPVYGWYPLLISLPTLVFILGLSFVVMVLVQNQSVTFVVLLGYIALTLFYLKHKLFGVFDYMALYVPLLYSDFVGFGRLGPVLVQRGIYLALGLSGIFVTVLALRRLPQSRAMVAFSRAAAVLFAAAGVGLAVGLVRSQENAERYRADLLQLNRRYFDEPVPEVSRCDLVLWHRGNELRAEARLTLRNRSAGPLDRYIFRLNPGLRVAAVQRGGKNLSFQRRAHLLIVRPPVPLAPGGKDSLTVRYSGTIDERACYLDVPEEKRTAPFRFFLYTAQKRYAFVAPDYLLLTPESGWYPQPGVGYNPDHPEVFRRQFTEYRLEVHADSALRPISQGPPRRVRPGVTVFDPGIPLSGISLALGRYRQLSTEIDSVEYSLALLPGHDYFRSQLGEVSDTLAAVVRAERDDFEASLGLYYPFARLQLVEVPIQFTSYRRVWTLGRETVQPEMVLLPEKGVLLETADFAGFRRRVERFRRFRGVTFTEKEIESRALANFIRSTFIRGRAFRFGRGALAGISADAFLILPNYLTYAYNLQSDRWPIFQAALEAYFASLAVPPEFAGFRVFEGVTDEEKVHIALTERSFLQLLRDPEFRDLVPTLVKEEGEALFYVLLSRIGADRFEDFLYTWLDNHLFQNLRVEDFVADVAAQFGFDLAGYLDRWLRSRELPAFLISPIDRYAVLDQGFTRYQVRFKVTNLEAAGGPIRASFRLAGGRFGFGFGGGSEEVERVFYLAGHETKEVGVVLDQQPRLLTVETFISRNLPSTLTFRVGEMDLNEKAVPFDGERTVSEPVQVEPPGEIIVDNEDPGFHVEEVKTTSLLRRLLKKSRSGEQKYVGLRFWNPPRFWKAAINANFFGRIVRSAYFIRAGAGDKKVSWTAKIPRNGYYELYAYVYRMRFGRRHGRRMGTYHFIVHHEGGAEEILLNLGQAEDGWNSLGSFYFSAGPAKVELTDESDGRLVIADAVKWVQR